MEGKRAQITAFVLDNSVAMRWLLDGAWPKDQRYAQSVLNSLIDAEAHVPNLWHLEAANVLLGAEQRGDVSAGEVERFIYQLENLPIQVDPQTAHQAFGRTRALSTAYGLSSYDAAYLELALREGLPIATLDKRLRQAATQADIETYLS